MSESIAGIPPQYRGPPLPPTTTSLEIVGESLSMLRQSLWARWDIWLFAAVFFTGTNIADIVFATPGSPLHSPMTIASLIVRIVADVWVVAAAIRAFTNRGAVWAIDVPLLRYAAASVALLAISMILLFIVARFVTHPLIALATHDAHKARVASLSVLCVWLLGFGIVTVRLSPWIAALAVGDNSIGLSAAWKAMRGATLAAIGAIVWTAPVPIAHLALTAQAQYLTGFSQIILTVIDSLVSVLQGLLAMAIASVLYRFVSENKPSP